MRFWHRRAAALRDLRSEDAAALAALHAGAFHRGWSEDEFERLLASAACVGQGAAYAEHARLRGFVLSRVAGREAEMLSIVVDPSARRRGLARALMARHVDHLRRSRVRELFLEVDEHNRAALALYKAFGLLAVGRRDAYYASPTGARSAALILRRELG